MVFLRRICAVLLCSLAIGTSGSASAGRMFRQLAPGIAANRLFDYGLQFSHVSPAAARARAKYIVNTSNWFDGAALGKRGAQEFMRTGNLALARDADKGVR
jgi:hypothetical protein